MRIKNNKNKNLDFVETSTVRRHVSTCRVAAVDGREMCGWDFLDVVLNGRPDLWQREDRGGGFGSF